MGNTAKARHRRQRRQRIQSAAVHRLLSINRKDAKRARLAAKWPRLAGIAELFNDGVIRVVGMGTPEQIESLR